MYLPGYYVLLLMTLPKACIREGCSPTIT